MGRLIDLHEKLTEMTKPCCPDMRTPQKEGVFGTVHGCILDNSCVPHPRLKEGDMTLDMLQGLNLFLAMHKGSLVLNMNLADLIAIARAADPEKVRALEGQ